jgi:ATP-dependent DNA helicase RecG
MKLEQLIGEATEYEKKVMLEVKKPKSWLKSVSAFANGVGGVLILVLLMMTLWWGLMM